MDSNTHAVESGQRGAQAWPHISTRIVVWLSGNQDIRTDITGGGAPGARLSVSWSCLQISFTAADQAAMMASELRALRGVSAVLPECIPTHLIHGDAAQFGPLPSALVTFGVPKTILAIPGSSEIPGSTQRMRHVDLGRVL